MCVLGTASGTKQRGPLSPINGLHSLPKMPGSFPTQANLQDRKVISPTGAVPQDVTSSCLFSHSIFTFSHQADHPTALGVCHVICAGHHQLPSQTWLPGISEHQHCCPTSLLQPFLPASCPRVVSHNHTSPISTSCPLYSPCEMQGGSSASCRVG